MRSLVALGLVLIAAPVHAAERPDRGHGIFFNRPGSSVEAMVAEREQCAAIASGTASQVTAVGVLTGGILAGIIGGEIAGGRLRRLNVENCMVIGGWRLFAFTSSEGRAFKAKPEAAQIEEMKGLVAAETPERGSLLRTWDNDYAEPKFWQKN